MKTQIGWESTHSGKTWVIEPFTVSGHFQKIINVKGINHDALEVLRNSGKVPFLTESLKPVYLNKE